MKREEGGREKEGEEEGEEECQPRRRRTRAV